MTSLLNYSQPPTSSYVYNPNSHYVGYKPANDTRLSSSSIPSIQLSTNSSIASTSSSSSNYYQQPPVGNTNSPPMHSQIQYQALPPQAQQLPQRQQYYVPPQYAPQQFAQPGYQLHQAHQQPPHYVTYYQSVYGTGEQAIAGSPSLNTSYYGYERRKSKQSSTWTPKEDKLLRELKEVQKLGWRDISSFFHDRTPNACQFRWRRIISGTNGGSISGAAGELETGKGKYAKKSHHSISYILN